MRYSIHHRTRYLYEDNVSYSHHLARLAPLDLPHQRRLSHRLFISPAPDVLTSHTDYYENSTNFFSLTTPHRELIIDSFSQVFVDPPADLALDISPSWEHVRDHLKNPLTAEDLAAAEFICASPLCPVSHELAAYAHESFTPGRSVLEAAIDLTHRIHEDFAFNPAATSVTTPVMEVFQNRAGVCQDFAHLQIACLRSIGLPARYVSGYLRTEPPPGQPRLIGADASHAWTSLYVPQLGWTELDATNDALPTTDHIRVAYGRDYHDICPIRGTVYGGGSQILEIGVTVTPGEGSN